MALTPPISWSAPTTTPSVPSLSTTSTVAASEKHDLAKETPGPAGPNSNMVSTAPPAGVLPYAVLFIIWSLVIVVGLGLVWAYRVHKGIRIRDWRSIAVAVMAIHVLFVVCLVASWISNKFPCSAMFWAASILNPVCWAAYQVPNARLISYYLANRNSGMARRPGQPVKYFRTWHSWKMLSVIERTYTAISAGLLCQFLLTALMYFGSRHFHAEYGLWGTWNNKNDCERGPPW